MKLTWEWCLLPGEAGSDAWPVCVRMMIRGVREYLERDVEMEYVGDGVLSRF